MSISSGVDYVGHTLFGSRIRVINTILTIIILIAVPITLQQTFQRQDLRQRASPTGYDAGCPNDPNVNGVTYTNANVCSYSPCEVGTSYTVPGHQQAKYYYAGTNANQDCINAGLGAFCCTTINPATTGGGGGGGSSSGPPDLYIYIIQTDKQLYNAGETATVRIYVKNNGGSAWSGTISGKYYANTAEGTNHVSQCMAIGSSPYGAVCDSANIKSFSSPVTITAGGYAQLSGIPTFTVQNAPGGAWMVYGYINIPPSVTETDAAQDTYSYNGGNNMSGSSYGVNASTATRCDATPYCSGACTAPANTCSTGNGTQGNCVYTTKSTGGSCNTYQAPNQPCTKDMCAPNTCSGGVCTSGGGGTTPTCNSAIVCTGSCTAPANTCGASNGTKSSCTYTRNTAGGTCSAAAPNQPCGVDNCTSPNTCSGGTCSAPPPASTPTCNTSATCGSCSAPANTCSTNNGTKPCTYTAYTGGGNCTQASAPSQSCTANNCTAPNTCTNGTCSTVSSTPTCDATIVCSGACSAPANTCSSNNGTKSGCNYTTYSGGGNCTQASAPSQSCTVSNCTSPNVCSNGTCTAPNTPTPTLTPTMTPSPTPSPTPTTALASATFTLSLKLPGIGSESYNNNNPKPSKNLSFDLYSSSNNQKVKSSPGNLNYQGGAYTGTVTVSGLTPGSYYAKLRFNNTLLKKSTAVNIAAGASNQSAISQTLVSGDIFAKNTIGLQEYNALVNCYNGGACPADTQALGDLNDDGKVDAKDINIVLVEFARGYFNGD